jgi:hypothetical protein
VIATGDTMTTHIGAGGLIEMGPAGGQNGASRSIRPLLSTHHHPTYVSDAGTGSAG